MDVVINEKATVTQVDKLKYLAAIVGRNGVGEWEIKHRLQEAKKMVGCLNTILGRAKTSANKQRNVLAKYWQNLLYAMAPKYGQ